STRDGSCSRTQAMLPASFLAGITTLTRPASAGRVSGSGVGESSGVARTTVIVRAPAPGEAWAGKRLAGSETVGGVDPTADRFEARARGPPLRMSCGPTARRPSRDWFGLGSLGV